MATLGEPVYVVDVNGNAASLFANPMTSPGDLIVGGALGAATRLAIGTDGDILVNSGGSPAWLSKGTDAQVLTMVSGEPVWAAASGGGSVNANSLTGTTLAGNVVNSSLTGVGVLAGPHMTSPVVDSGGITVTAGGVTVTAGGLTVTAGGLVVSAGTLTAAAGISVTTAGVAITAGGLTVTAGGATITAGNLGVGVAANANTALSVQAATTVNGASDGDFNGTMTPSANSATFRGLRVRTTFVQGAHTLGTAYGIEVAPTWTQGAGSWTTQAGIFINPTFAASGVQAAILVNAGTVVLAAGVAGAAPLNIPPGVAPTTPANGDMWTTTTAVLIRLNGATKTFTIT